MWVLIFLAVRHRQGKYIFSDGSTSLGKLALTEKYIFLDDYKLTGKTGYQQGKYYFFDG
jgi:hypothetical protein